MTKIIFPDDRGEDQEWRITEADPLTPIEEKALGRVRSPNTRRTYATAYRLWREWCHEEGIPTVHWTVNNVEEWLKSTCNRNSTAKVRLSAMRKLAAAAADIYEQEELPTRLHQRLIRFTDLVIDESSASPKRQRKALSKREVFRLIDHYPRSDKDFMSTRNRALYRIMLHTGLRRSEVIAVKVDHISFEDGLLEVVDGKGRYNETEVIPILGDEALEDIEYWVRIMQKELPGFEWLFPRMRRGNSLVASPLTSQGLYEICLRTSNETGIWFRPHDTRRTLATHLMNSDMPDYKVKQITRHKKADTLHLYGMDRQAKDLRDEAKLPWD